MVAAVVRVCARVRSCDNGGSELTSGTKARDRGVKRLGGGEVVST